MREKTSERRLSGGSLFCVLFLLVLLELAAVFGRVSGIRAMKNSLNVAEHPLVLSGARKSGEKPEAARLCSGQMPEIAIQAGTGRQRSVIRMISRSHAAVCGLLLFCVFLVFFRLFFRYAREELHFFTDRIISYRYCLSYL